MEQEDVDAVDDITDDLEVIYVADEDLIGDIGDEDEEEAVDLSKFTFTKHSSSVFIGALSKSGVLAVTGGEDDLAFVWTVEHGDVVLECTGHKDSVTEVGFNFNDQYVATGDMGGLIQVWDINDRKLIWCYEGDDMEWLLWHHLANVLISGTKSGDIYIWQIPEGHCKVLPSHGATTLCARLLTDGKRLIAGYSDGQVRLWDLKGTTVLWQISTNIPIEGVTSLDVTDDSALIIVAPSAQLFKVTDGVQVASYLLSTENEIEVAAFNADLGLVATGALSGQLCVWDYKKNILRHEVKLEMPVTIIKWGVGDRLFVGCTNGWVYVCDAKSGTLVEILTGHRSDILSLSLNKEGNLLLTTCDDGMAKLFPVKVD
ncbi:hypothetical protein FQA39_LY08103 [Lamprigera yunnana]|nr:hypothetical protein FQA39_LY08103 [Lamprigera yunnana]